MSSYQYRKSHCGDKTILRPSYLHNGISYTGKMISLYWIGALSPAQLLFSEGNPPENVSTWWRHHGIYHSQPGHKSLLWRHNGRDSVSNHQPHHCLLNRLFRRSSKKTSKLRATGLCAGNSPGPVNSLHKWPVTRKMFPFDDVIMSNVRFSLTAFVEKLQEVIDIHVLWRWRFVTFVTFVFSSAWGVGIWLTSSTCWFSFFRGNRLVVWYCVQFFFHTALCHRVCSFHCIISHSYRAFCIWGKWKRK